MSEKRKETRTLQKLLVRFDGEDFSIYSKTRDLSDHGAFISTHYMLNPGTEIMLTLDQSQIEKKARVVRVAGSSEDKDIDNTGFGVEFVV